MSLTCKIFGHKTNPHKYGEIVALRNPWYDGIGRSHHNITATCERCEEKFTICKVHGYTAEEFAKISEDS